LTAAKLFARFMPLDRHGTYYPVDLTPFYNCALDQPVHNDPKGPGPSFKNFPAGTNAFGGVTFSVGGVIQLNGGGLQAQQPGRYTNLVTSIPIGRKLTRLHFLGGVGWAVPDRGEIGQFIVHYETEAENRIPIIYDKHVKDWWQEGPSGGFDSPIVAWAGDINKDQGGSGPGHVYRYFWVNPQPDVTIVTVDFKSNMTQAGPFLLGITAEAD